MPNDMELTPEQEQEALAIWNLTPSSPPGIDKITKLIFKDEKLDGRCNEAKAVKRCLAKHNLVAPTKTNYESKTESVVLTDEHKEFIRNNANTMTGNEMAKQIFQNPNLHNLSIHTRAVNLFIKNELDSTTIFRPEEQAEIPEGDYRPPKSLVTALARVNQYVNFTLNKDNLNAGQKRGVEALINYLHNFRFNKQINMFDNENDRRTLEDAFVRYTYDKPDLTQEEIDQYILLSTEGVRAFKAQRRHEILQDQLENLTGSGEENIRISMSLVEAIGKASKEYDDCVKHQENLLDSLKENRSKRLSKQLSDNASILNLIQLWKMHETREQMLKMAKLEQQGIANEVERLSTIDDIKAKILGMTKEEALFS